MSRFPCKHEMSPENTDWDGYEPVCRKCARAAIHALKVTPTSEMGG